MDSTAERIASLGASPTGTPGRLVAQHGWDDYDLGRADALEHMGAFDVVIEAQREAIAKTNDLDPVTQDMLSRAGAPSRRLGATAGRNHS